MLAARRRSGVLFGNKAAVPMSTPPVMRPPRRLLFFLTGLAAAVVATVALVSLPTVQTALARRVLASHPEWGVVVDRVGLRWGSLRLEGLKWAGPSADVAAPKVELDFSVPDLLWDRAATIRAVRARDLAITARERAVVPAVIAATPAAPGDAAPPAAILSGLLRRVELPVNLSLDGVDVAGGLALPGRPAPVTFSARGGGFADGLEGKLEVALGWDSGDPRIGSFSTSGVLRARMSGPRSFSEVLLNLDSDARGDAFPGGASISSEVRVFRDRASEGYRLAVATPRHPVLEVAGELRPGDDRLRGNWRLDLTSSDLAPLALGFVLPGFTARGEGALEIDPAAAAPRAAGKINLGLRALEVLRPELKALGDLTLHADFDAGWSSGVVSVEKFSARLEGKRPVLGVDVNQPFTVNPARQEWFPAKTNGELARIRIEGVPTAWLSPWFAGVELEGGDWTGEIAAEVADGGLSLRTVRAVMGGALAVTRAGNRIMNGGELACAGSATLRSDGWQARIETLVLRALGQDLAKSDLRVGRLAGPDQPIKAEANLRLDLAAVARQPWAEGRLAIAAGELSAKLAATLGSEPSIHLDGRTARLRGGPAAAELPALAVDLRAGIDRSGRISVSAPLRLTKDDRVSDLKLAGEFVPRAGSPGGRVDARLTGGVVHVTDGEALALLLGTPRSQAAPAMAAPVAVSAPKGPPWSDWEGRVEIDIAEVLRGDALRARDVKGKLELDAGKVRMEGLRGSLGERGRATVSGALAFEAGRPDPYAAEVQVEVREFDPGPWFRVASGGRPATLEGSFIVSSRLRGRAADLGGLSAAVTGEVLVSSRGGIFRGLPVKAGAVATGGGRVAGMIAAAGSALGGLTGRKEPPAVAGRAQAVAEFAAGLATIPFDQLSLVISRDAARNMALREFTLIAPELRLAGSGTLLGRREAGVLDDSVAVELSLRARGRQGDLLRYLGLLDPVVDDLGYAACRLPLRIAGTPARPDCTDLTERLAGLAAGKTGVTEKAGELLQRIIGAPK